MKLLLQLDIPRVRVTVARKSLPPPPPPPRPIRARPVAVTPDGCEVYELRRGGGGVSLIPSPAIVAAEQALAEADAAVVEARRAFQERPDKAEHVAYIEAVQRRRRCAVELERLTGRAP